MNVVLEPIKLVRNLEYSDDIKKHSILAQILVPYKKVFTNHILHGSK